MAKILTPKGLLGELSAEFLGTFILIVFGIGVVAQVSLTPFGEYANINWAWGLAVAMGIYVAGKISGAHLNPAVTIALAVRRGFPWRKVAPYALAQTLGAFVAALVVRWNYAEAFHAVDPGHTIKTQGVFSTLPGNGVLPVSQTGALRDQIIGTAILLILVLAVTDLRNSAPAANLAPFVVGLIVVVIGMAFGADAGYAINPARDFGPRLASFLTGWGNAFNDQHGAFYAWVPIVGPVIGAVVGAVVYDVFITRFLPKEEPVETPARATAGNGDPAGRMAQAA